MAKTTNIQLNKPLISDVYDLDLFNENSDILDAEITSIKESIDEGKPSDYFFASKESSASIPASAEIKLRMDTVKGNSGVWQGQTGSGDNYGFIPAYNGIWQLDWHMRWAVDNHPTAGWTLYIYEDDVLIKSKMAGWATERHASVSFIIPVVLGKKYDFRLTQFSAGASKLLDFASIDGVEVQRT